MKKEMNNKGFSLVELIIVIAIMAILVVVLAPQYLKYVERSRNSTDRDNATAIESALQVWGAETEMPAGTVAYTTDATGTTLTVTQNNNIAFSGTNAAAAEDALDNAGIPLATHCVSQTAWTQYIITITVDADGVVSVTNDIP